jgi:N-acyl-D-amino-acid deacylase
MRSPDEVPILLAGGMIFDGSGGPLFAGDVLIVGDRIESVVPAAESWDPPANARHTELRGRTLMPGLVDGHDVSTADGRR